MCRTNLLLISEGLAQAESLGAEENRAVCADSLLGLSVISMHFPVAPASLKVMKSLSLQKGEFKSGFRAQKCFCDCFSKPGPGLFSVQKAYHVPAKFTAARKKFQGDKVAGTEECVLKGASLFIIPLLLSFKSSSQRDAVFLRLQTDVKSSVSPCN